MSHLQFVALAYGVFAAVLAWDFWVPWFRLRQVRRSIVLRARRESARSKP